MFQVCSFKLIPSEIEDLNLYWLPSVTETPFNGLNLDYHASVRFSNQTSYYTDGKYSDYSNALMEITLERKYLRHVADTIIPTGALVVMSWVRICWY